MADKNMAFKCRQAVFLLNSDNSRLKHRAPLPCGRPQALPATFHNLRAYTRPNLRK
jgi:hypothetical protein